MPTLTAISDSASALPIASSSGQPASSLRAPGSFASSLAAAQGQSAAQPAADGAAVGTGLDGEGAKVASTLDGRTAAWGSLPAKKLPPNNLPQLSNTIFSTTTVAPQAAPVVPSLPVSGAGITDQIFTMPVVGPAQQNVVPSNVSSSSLFSQAPLETPSAQNSSRGGAAASVPANNTVAGPPTAVTSWLNDGATANVNVSDANAPVSNLTGEPTSKGSANSENASTSATAATISQGAITQPSAMQTKENQTTEIQTNEMQPSIKTLLASAPAVTAPQSNFEQGGGAGVSRGELPSTSGAPLDLLSPAARIVAQSSSNAPVLIASNEGPAVSLLSALPPAQSSPRVRAPGGVPVPAVNGASSVGVLVASSEQPGMAKANPQLSTPTPAIPATVSDLHPNQATRILLSTSAATAAGQPNQPSEAGSQTPFSVFFSEPRLATESAAGTLPKVILPPTASAIAGNLHPSFDASSARAAASVSPENNGHNAGTANSKNPSPPSASASAQVTQPQHIPSDGTAVIAGTAVATAPAPPATTGPSTVPVSAPPPATPAAADALAKTGPSSTLPGVISANAAFEALPAPVAGRVQMAQMISRAEQSEMRIGMNTSAFGSVEVRAVVHANDVALVVGSEKGDLRSLMNSELPAMANTLQEQNLRLHTVNFMQGFAFSNNSSGGGDSQPRSFVPPQAALSVVSPDVTSHDSSETMAREELNGAPGNLSILA